MLRLSRREYLALSLAVPALAGKRQLGRAPVISVQDFEQYPDLLTPLDDFFVRDHFDIPVIDPAAWRLRIGGTARDRTFSLTELEAFPRREVTSVLECAGNGVGVGAVGCARWKGVPLAELLRACDPAPSARFVRVTGMDRGREPDAPEAQYSRTLTIEDATRAETLLVLNMQGEPLRADHGAPARLLAAGRYGMDSIKWIERIDLLEQPGDSFYMTHRFRRVRGGNVEDPVGRIQVKSIIVKPAANAALRGDTLAAGGYAWAAPDPIARVEIRIDGAIWTAAELMGPPQPLAWVPWRLQIRPLRPGVHTIEARAVSKSGQIQPEQRDPGRDDEYELNNVQRVRFLSRP
jgi:DMSO/TMAO reductase YedYZ molybdopterin-dependent catalytic subunit